VYVTSSDGDHKAVPRARNGDPCAAHEKNRLMDILLHYGED
jgi:hypothetical protein